MWSAAKKKYGFWGLFSLKRAVHVRNTFLFEKMDKKTKTGRVFSVTFFSAYYFFFFFLYYSFSQTGWHHLRKRTHLQRQSANVAWANRRQQKANLAKPTTQPQAGRNQRSTQPKPSASGQTARLKNVSPCPKEGAPRWRVIERILPVFKFIHILKIYFFMYWPFERKQPLKGVFLW